MAQVTLSFDAWKRSPVTPATVEVPVNPTASRPAPKPGYPAAAPKK